MENIIIYKTIHNDYILTTEKLMKECRTIRLNGRLFFKNLEEIIKECLKINPIHHDKINLSLASHIFHEIVDTVEKLEDIPEKYPEYLLC